MAKNPIPSTLPDHYTQVTPSIRFIKKFLPNVELVNLKNSNAVLPEVVRVQEFDDKQKHLNKRDALHLKNDLISQNRYDASQDAYLGGDYPRN